MIDKTELQQVINQALEGTKMYLVTLKVSKDNVIEVALDSDEDITIDDCVAVNDAVLEAFDRDEEDYELTVGSYGITSPLLLPLLLLHAASKTTIAMTSRGMIRRVLFKIGR